MIVRPGPARIEPDQAPGGLVVHVYSVPSCVLLLERRLPDLAAVLAHAHDDGELVFSATDECCLVAYDGDTGERMTPPERDIYDDDEATG